MSSVLARVRGSLTLQIAGAAILFRVLSALVGFLLNLVFPDYQPEQFTVLGRTSLFWDTFARNDSGWYWQIARYGYTEGPAAYVPGGRSTIAFFPAYPILMAWVGRAIGRRPADLYLGGIVVSWIAFAVAAVLMARLARLDLRREHAGRAVAAMTVFPFAFFFGVVYTEALFLAATLGAFYAFRTRRWIVGGLCGALASATRVNGVLMWPALAWVAWQAVARDDQSPAERARAVCGLLLVPLGIGAYSFYIYRLSGNPFEWIASIQRWGYFPGQSPILAPLSLVENLIVRPYSYLTTEPMAPYDAFNGLTALAFIVAIPLVWRRFGAAYGLFMASNLWLPLSSGQFEGLGRYCSVLFPFYLLVAAVPSRPLFVGLVIGFALLYTVALAMFVNIHPIL